MRNLLNRKRGSIAYSLSLSPVHCPDMTNTVERDVKSQVIHLSWSEIECIYVSDSVCQYFDCPLS